MRPRSVAPTNRLHQSSAGYIGYNDRSGRPKYEDRISFSPRCVRPRGSTAAVVSQGRPRPCLDLLRGFAAIEPDQRGSVVTPVEGSKSAASSGTRWRCTGWDPAENGCGLPGVKQRNFQGPGAVKRCRRPLAEPRNPLFFPGPYFLRGTCLFLWCLCRRGSCSRTVFPLGRPLEAPTLGGPPLLTSGKIYFRQPWFFGAVPSCCCRWVVLLLSYLLYYRRVN